MRKHVLSTFGDFYYDNDITQFAKNEGDCVDENRLVSGGPTIITRSHETSDADEFVYGPTAVTETLETSDADEFNLQGPTIKTFSQETSDVDEFCLVEVMDCYDILLI